MNKNEAKRKKAISQAGIEHFYEQVPEDFSSSMLQAYRGKRFVSTITGTARLPLSQIEAFVKRVDMLVQEFEQMSVPGEHMYSFLTIISQMDIPPLSEKKEE